MFSVATYTCNTSVTPNPSKQFKFGPPVLQAKTRQTQKEGPCIWKLPFGAFRLPVCTMHRARAIAAR